MARPSIFNRGFRLAFNQNKYMNLTAHDQPQSHLGWVSVTDYKFGRAMFYFTILCGGITMYLDPSYLHETFGHPRQPPKHIIGLGNGLDSQEKKLNLQILERQHAEEKLEHFKHTVLAFDGK